MLQLDARDILDHVHQAVDRDEFVRAQVDRLLDLAVHDLENAFHAIVDVHEAAGLLAVAPDFDFVGTGFHGVNHLAANGGRGFFAAAVPGAVRAVDVVEAGHARREADSLRGSAGTSARENSFSQP